MSKIKQIVCVSKDQYGGEDLIAYSLVDIEKYEANFGERALSHSFMMDSFRKIMGRTLTIIDASIADKQQNKAIKDLVRQIFSDEMNDTANWAFDQKALMNSIGEQEPIGGPVTIEEALGVK